MTPVPKRKLIEVALPLEAINRACQHEKSVPRKGHPATMHLWWARRPLAACRAVLFAQLVDDPSAHPDRFPTEEAQAVERRRLFDLLERLVVWENAGNEALLRQAHEEIARSFDGDPPSVLDPFAGGGSIPLEAQRLGLVAHASDLNPVAVLINKALIEIPPRWAGQQPVFPGVAQSRLGGWPRASGLAEDVRRYGTWMRDEAESRIGHLYPQTALPDGTPTTVIAWLWARTVTCPNPACGATLPLVSSLWLSKKKGRPTWLRPLVTGTDVTFEVVVDSSGPPDSPKQGRGAKFACLVCGDVTTDAYVKAEGMAGRMGQQLLATVAEGRRQRVYLSPTAAAAQVAKVARPDDAPETEMAVDPRNIWCVNYGLRTFADLFTDRQLTALTTFSDLIPEVGKAIESDARAAGIVDAEQYAADIATYLSFAISKLADWSSSICSWIPQIEGLTHTFSKQAIPMTWDFTEVNVFSSSAGNFLNHVEWVAATPEALVPGRPGAAGQSASTAVAFDGQPVVATDPPYYDNIGYSDLADFFYVWLRRSLRDIHPELLSTLLTPKAEELIASPYRFEGSKARAEEHFETGFVSTFQRIRESHPIDVPITVFYAFKQAESDEAGTASTGWETMLNGLIEAGLTVTATWPMRTERSARSIGIGTNALASSIVLACRPREATAEATTRRGFLQALKDELPTALREMQQGSIAPVDLAQAAIGPGMAVFTRYRTVVEADGSAMTVRTALALINQVLDEVLSEQEGDFDADTRFCVKWFSQFGWDEAESGTADTLSRATNTSVAGLDRGGVFRARAGRARLVPPEEMSSDWDPHADERVSVWEVVVRLAQALDESGGEQAARLMARAGQRVDLDTAKELAYLLYSMCEKRRWTQTALLFNGLGTSWSDLSAAARVGGALTPPPAQGALDFDSRE